MNTTTHRTLWIAALCSAALIQPLCAATKTAAANGNWTASATWSPSGAPLAGDDVVIPEGKTVTYDSTSLAVINTVKINGTLAFRTTASTNLSVGIVKIGADTTATSAQPGKLIIGSEESPIPRGVKATIQLAETAGDTDSDHPAIFVYGGRIVVHGAPITRPWVKLTANAPSGATSVTANPLHINDWAVGDEIIIVGTNNGKSGFSNPAPTYRLGASPRSTPQTEKRTITALNTSTGQISFSGGLVYTHSPVSGNFPEVANLTRTVEIKSLDKTVDTKRGHTFIGNYSSGYLRYARFEGLGKEGVLGRYPVHVHMATSTLRGFSIVGNSVSDSHNKFVAVHRCNYILVKDNVGYQAYTSGFFMEDATEVYCLFDGNLAVQAMKGARASNEALDFTSGNGYGFWWSNGRNSFIRNAGAENDMYGFLYEIVPVKYYYGVLQNPNQGSTAKVDLKVPMLQEDGTTADTTVKAVRILRFEGNEGHNEHMWSMEFRGGGWSLADPSVMKNNKIWTSHYPFSIGSHGARIENTKSWNSNYGFEIARVGSGQHTDNITWHDLSLTDSTVQNLGFEYAGGNVTLTGTTSLLRSSTGVKMGSSIFPTTPGFASKIVINSLVEDYPGGIFAGGGEAGYNDFIYVNDRYGIGAAAKVKGDQNTNPGDGLTYALDPNLNFTSTKSATTSNHTSNTPVIAVDKRKPASAITSLGGTPGTVHNMNLIRGANNSITLKGFAVDDGSISNVKVNGVTATAIVSDWSQWAVTLTNLPAGSYTFTSQATDTSGKLEANPHAVTVNLQ